MLTSTYISYACSIAEEVQVGRGCSNCKFSEACNSAEHVGDDIIMDVPDEIAIVIGADFDRLLFGCLKADDSEEIYLALLDALGQKQSVASEDKT